MDAHNNTDICMYIGHARKLIYEIAAFLLNLMLERERERESKNTAA